MASVNEDSILCHDISNDDGNVSENEELSVSLMQLNEKYIKFPKIILVLLLFIKVFFCFSQIIVNYDFHVADLLITHKILVTQISHQ